MTPPTNLCPIFVGGKTLHCCLQQAFNDGLITQKEAKAIRATEYFIALVMSDVVTDDHVRNLVEAFEHLLTSLIEAFDSTEPGSSTRVHSSELRVAQLQEECKKRGIPTEGLRVRPILLAPCYLYHGASCFYSNLMCATSFGVIACSSKMTFASP